MVRKIFLLSKTLIVRLFQRFSSFFDLLVFLERFRNYLETIDGNKKIFLTHAFDAFLTRVPQCCYFFQTLLNPNLTIRGFYRDISSLFTENSWKKQSSVSCFDVPDSQLSPSFNFSLFKILILGKDGDLCNPKYLLTFL